MALVKGHFLQRVKHPTPELLTVSHGDQQVGGVSTIEMHRRFELPPSTEGNILVFTRVSLLPPQPFPPPPRIPKDLSNI